MKMLTDKEFIAITVLIICAIVHFCKKIHNRRDTEERRRKQMIKKYQKYHRLYGLDEHDVRALEIQERTEREEERHYKAERKRMIREWDEVHRESKR